MQGKRVVVFGGSGFVGRYLVRRLAQAGANVTVAVRDPEAALFLKPMGDVGQIAPVYANVRKPKSVARAMEGADAVVNLVGVLHQGDQSFAGAHVIGTKNVAEAAAAAGVTRFIQVSALGADPKGASTYAQTKAAGEAAALAAVPTATIVRPSVLFGPEDDFLNKFGAMSRISPALPLIDGGRTRFQPLYVGDLADALMGALRTDDAQGKTYELGGPRVMSFRDILEYVLQQTERFAFLAPLPSGLAKAIGLFAQLLPNPPLTMDQVTLLASDSVANPDMPGLSDLGVTAPTPIEAIAPAYLARYQKPKRLGVADAG